MNMVMITTAEDAVTVADEFLSSHYRYRLPVSAKREEDFWRVVFDVGALKSCNLTLKLDADSGRPVDFNLPSTVPEGETAGKVRRHVIHSRRYFDRALLALEKRDAWESGKLIWRSVEQAFLGAAISHGYTVTNKQDLRTFVRRMSDGPDGKRLFSGFIVASHGEGFQATDPEPYDIEERLPDARWALTRAFALLSPELADSMQAPGQPNTSQIAE